MTKPNHNLEVVREAARDNGAEIVEITARKKHTLVQLRTSGGANVFMYVNLGNVDPYKLRGWVRQKLINPSSSKTHRKRR